MSEIKDAIEYLTCLTKGEKWLGSVLCSAICDLFEGNPWATSCIKCPAYIRFQNTPKYNAGYCVFDIGGLRDRKCDSELILRAYELLAIIEEKTK